MQPQGITFQSLIPPAPKINERGQPAFLQASSKHLLYFNKNTVILRPISHSLPTLALTHPCKITAAKFSHDYCNVASVDEKGTLMIHEVCGDRLQESKVFPNCYLGCQAMDWTADNKKICLVGTGQKKYGRVISADMGTDVGDITGVTASLTAVSFRPERPYKLALGGDEKILKFFEGPPYKFVCSKPVHSNFINQIKHSPDGKRLVSISSDRKIVIIDGTSHQVLRERVDAHSAGITGVAWLNNEHFVTVSSDKTIRMWDSDSLDKEIKILKISQDEDQLKLVDSFITAVTYCLGSDKIYCLCLSGEIKEVEKDLSKVTRSLEGNRGKPLKVVRDNKTGCLIVVDSNGKVFSLSTENGEFSRLIKGYLSFGKYFLDASYDDSSQLLYVLAGEDKAIVVDTKNPQSLIQQVQIGLASLVSHLSKGQGFLYVSSSSIQVFTKNGHNQFSKSSHCKVDYDPTILIKSEERDLFFIGTLKGKVCIYEYEAGQIKIKCQFHNTGYQITCITQHQEYLFVGDSMGGIKVWRWDGAEAKKVEDMGSHTTKITEILVHNGVIHTFSMDKRHSIWNLDKFNRIKTEENVHQGGIVGAVISSDKMITYGDEMLMKVHKID